MSVTGTNISLTLRNVKGSELTYSELDGNQSNLKTSIENHSHDEFAAALGTDDNYVTDAEKAALHSHSNKTALDAVSGVNTGDQDLSNYSLTTHDHAGVYDPAGTAATALSGHTSAYDHTKLHDPTTVADSTSIDLTIIGQQISAAAVFGTASGTVAEGNHNHAGVYEPADATILKDADIGVTVQAYNADLTSWAAIAPSAKQDTLVSGTNIKTINSASILGPGDLTVTGGMSAAAISTATTAVKDTRYICDTSAGAFAITLPLNPAAGDYLEIVDAKGTFATNNLTIARNGSVIDGTAEDLVCDIPNIFLTLTYSGNTTRGWQIDLGGEEAIVSPDGDKGDVAISGGGTTYAVQSVAGNLDFLGTAARIRGDFSNATISNRTMFQTSTANGNTQVEVIPNGTSTVANYVVSNNSADPANASLGSLYVDNVNVRIQSLVRGTGTYLPMTFFTGGSERMRIDTSGNVGIGLASVANNRLRVMAETSDSTTNAISAVNSAGTPVFIVGGNGQTLVLSPTGLGYGAGAGGTVTQSTSRTTAVTLNKPTGTITMFSAAGSTAWSLFTFNNSLISVSDTLALSYRNTTNFYTFQVANIGNGACSIAFIASGTATDAPVINFAIIKGATS